jgi:transcriptional regulator with XRE-family HTH domain
LARRIDERRQSKKLSVNHLADFSGVSRGYMSKLLNAKKSPTLRMIEKIAEALDTDVVSLLEPAPKSKGSTGGADHEG